MDLFPSHVNYIIYLNNSEPLEGARNIPSLKPRNRLCKLMVGRFIYIVKPFGGLSSPIF